MEIADLFGLVLLEAVPLYLRMHSPTLPVTGQVDKEYSIANVANGSGSNVRANGRCATLTGQGGRMLKVDKMMIYLRGIGMGL